MNQPEGENFENETVCAGCKQNLSEITIGNIVWSGKNLNVQTFGTDNNWIYGGDDEAGVHWQWLFPGSIYNRREHYKNWFVSVRIVKDTN